MPFHRSRQFVSQRYTRVDLRLDDEPVIVIDRANTRIDRYEDARRACFAHNERIRTGFNNRR